ncbi:MAG: CNNM domain-containing protein [Paludibacteraceae bacterium]|nr:CNNM domain-containing protein [Paludibacteraceae bacterium]
MTLLIIALIATLGISFLCSLLEATLYNATSSYIESLPTEKNGVENLKNLKSNIEKPIAAILSLNTIANTAGAAAVGAQAVDVFGSMYFGLCSVVLTILVLICSEIIPKTIGSNYWRELCIPAGYIIRVILYLCYPLVIMSQFLTRLFTRKQVQTVSREEVAALTNIGEREGVFKKNESIIINNLVKMEKVKVHSIMTPRTVVLAAQEDMTLEEFFKDKKFLTYSRIPIYTNDFDDITGFVLKADILFHLANGEDQIKLKEIKRDIMVCYENTSITKFYDLMVARKEQIALVIDEYGGMDGIITLEDVIETILGLEITDEFDNQTDMQAFAKALWQKRAEQLNFAQVEENEESNPS